MFDSVFSKFTGFSGEYFPNDKLILGEKKVLEALENAENKGAGVISKIPLEAVKKLKQDPEKVREFLRIQLERSLYAVWLAGWNLGGNHGNTEIKKQSPKRATFSNDLNLIYFNERDDRNKPGVRVQSIRNVPAERAIRARINQLAGDVSNSEYTRIQQDLLAAVTPQGRSGQPISRSNLIDRIEETLGSKSGRFKRRAETIARTELTFAYNAGRLETYRQSGLVTAVTFYTIIDERRCPVCASRHGLVIPLDNWRAIAQITPPLHPNCRCVLSPVLKDDPRLDEPDRKIENRELIPRPVLWAGAAILAAVLLGAATKKGSSKAIEIGKDVVVGLALEKAVQEIKEAVEGKSQQLEPMKESTEEVTEETPEEIDTRFLVNGVDLNTATREEIQALLPGRLLNVRQISEILRYRRNNRIDSIDDLKKIPQIGKKTLERLIQLSEGFDPVTMLNDIKSPVQLWASNLGLTRSQANTVFQELQKAPFKNIEDMRQRLKGKGIGDKTIENIRQRLAIINQSSLTSQAQPTVQPSNPNPPDASTPPPIEPPSEPSFSKHMRTVRFSRRKRKRVIFRKSKN